MTTKEIRNSLHEIINELSKVLKDGIIPPPSPDDKQIAPLETQDTL